jgi:3-oxoacyl-[acyl-carrier protein] reductase
MLLDGKVALITGASRGIGAATAKLFGKEGAKVAVNYVKDEKSANEIVEEINNSHGTAMAIHGDIRYPEQINSMFEKVKSEFGEIDILVLNAGMNFRVAPFTDYNWDEFEAKLLGEIQSAFYCCKAVVPSMIERKSGCIIGISSGLSRRPNTGFTSHTTTKAGLNGFMKSLAFELSPYGIRVNTVAPGLTDTDAVSFMKPEQKQAAAHNTPLRRIAMPDDIAGGILFFASEQSKFISGSYMPVDGGNTML